MRYNREVMNRLIGELIRHPGTGIEPRFEHLFEHGLTYKEIAPHIVRELDYFSDRTSKIMRMRLGIGVSEIPTYREIAQSFDNSVSRSRVGRVIKQTKTHLKFRLYVLIYPHLRDETASGAYEKGDFDSVVELMGLQTPVGFLGQAGLNEDEIRNIVFNAFSEYKKAIEEAGAEWRSFRESRGEGRSKLAREVYYHGLDRLCK